MDPPTDRQPTICARRRQQVSHRDRFAALGREERGVHRDVADVATRELQPRELMNVDGSTRRRRWKRTAPQVCAQLDIGKRERDHEAQSPQECLIDGIALIRGEDREPAICLHAL